MPIVIVCICGVVCLIMMFISTELISNDGVLLVAEIAFGIMAVVLVLISIAALCFGERKVISTEVTEPTTYQLAKVVIGDRDLYLFERDGKFQYDYIDGDKAEHEVVSTSDSTIRYGEDQPYVVFTQTTDVERLEWWIFYGSESTRVTHEYEFTIPSRDYVDYSYEK